jgi:hypothetical protein
VEFYTLGVYHCILGFEIIAIIVNSYTLGEQKKEDMIGNCVPEY